MKTWFTCIVLYNGFQENAMDLTNKRKTMLNNYNNFTKSFLILLCNFIQSLEIIGFTLIRIGVGSFI